MAPQTLMSLSQFQTLGHAEINAKTLSQDDYDALDVEMSHYWAAGAGSNDRYAALRLIATMALADRPANPASALLPQLAEQAPYTLRLDFTEQNKWPLSAAERNLHLVVVGTLPAVAQDYLRLNILANSVFYIATLWYDSQAWLVPTLATVLREAALRQSATALGTDPQYAYLAQAIALQNAAQSYIAQRRAAGRTLDQALGDVLVAQFNLSTQDVDDSRQRAIQSYIDFDHRMQPQVPTGRYLRRDLRTSAGLYQASSPWWQHYDDELTCRQFTSCAEELARLAVLNAQGGIAVHTPLLPLPHADIWAGFAADHPAIIADLGQGIEVTPDVLLASSQQQILLDYLTRESEMPGRAAAFDDPGYAAQTATAQNAGAPGFDALYQALSDTFNHYVDTHRGGNGRVPFSALLASHSGSPDTGPAGIKMLQLHPAIGAPYCAADALLARKSFAAWPSIQTRINTAYSLVQSSGALNASTTADIEAAYATIYASTALPALVSPGPAPDPGEMKALAAALAAYRTDALIAIEPSVWLTGSNAVQVGINTVLYASSTAYRNAYANGLAAGRTATNAIYGWDGLSEFGEEQLYYGVSGAFNIFAIDPDELQPVADEDEIDGFQIDAFRGTRKETFEQYVIIGMEIDHEWEATNTTNNKIRMDQIGYIRNKLLREGVPDQNISIYFITTDETGNDETIFHYATDADGTVYGPDIRQSEGGNLSFDSRIIISAHGTRRPPGSVPAAYLCGASPETMAALLNDFLPPDSGDGNGGGIKSIINTACNMAPYGVDTKHSPPRIINLSSTTDYCAQLATELNKLGKFKKGYIQGSPGSGVISYSGREYRIFSHNEYPILSFKKGVTNIGKPVGQKIKIRYTMDKKTNVIKSKWIDNTDKASNMLTNMTYEKNLPYVDADEILNIKKKSRTSVFRRLICTRTASDAEAAGKHLAQTNAGSSAYQHVVNDGWILNLADTETMSDGRSRIPVRDPGFPLSGTDYLYSDDPDLERLVRQIQAQADVLTQSPRYGGSRYDPTNAQSANFLNSALAFESLILALEGGALVDGGAFSSALNTSLTLQASLSLVQTVFGIVDDLGGHLALAAEFKQMNASSLATDVGKVSKAAHAIGFAEEGLMIALDIAVIGLDIVAIINAENAQQRALFYSKLAFDVIAVVADVASLVLIFAASAALAAVASVAAIVLAGVVIGVGALASNDINNKYLAQAVADLLSSWYNACANGGYQYDATAAAMVPGPLVVTSLVIHRTTLAIEFDTPHIFANTDTNPNTAPAAVGGTAFRPLDYWKLASSVSLTMPSGTYVVLPLSPMIVYSWDMVHDEPVIIDNKTAANSLWPSFCVTWGGGITGAHQYVTYHFFINPLSNQVSTTTVAISLADPDLFVAFPDLTDPVPVGVGNSGPVNVAFANYMRYTITSHGGSQNIMFATTQGGYTLIDASASTHPTQWSVNLAAVDFTKVSNVNVNLGTLLAHSLVHGFSFGPATHASTPRQATLAWALATTTPLALTLVATRPIIVAGALAIHYNATTRALSLGSGSATDTLILPANQPIDITILGPQGETVRCATDFSHILLTAIDIVDGSLAAAQTTCRALPAASLAEFVYFYTSADDADFPLIAGIEYIWDRQRSLMVQIDMRAAGHASGWLLGRDSSNRYFLPSSGSTIACAQAPSSQTVVAQNIISLPLTASASMNVSIYSGAPAGTQFALQQNIAVSGQDPIVALYLLSPPPAAGANGSGTLNEFVLSTTLWNQIRQNQALPAWFAALFVTSASPNSSYPIVCAEFVKLSTSANDDWLWVVPLNGKTVIHSANIPGQVVPLLRETDEWNNEYYFFAVPPATTRTETPPGQAFAQKGRFAEVGMSFELNVPTPSAFDIGANGGLIVSGGDQARYLAQHDMSTGLIALSSAWLSARAATWPAAVAALVDTLRQTAAAQSTTARLALRVPATAIVIEGLTRADTSALPAWFDSTIGRFAFASTLPAASATDPLQYLGLDADGTHAWLFLPLGDNGPDSDAGTVYSVPTLYPDEVAARFTGLKLTGTLPAATPLVGTPPLARASIEGGTPAAVGASGLVFDTRADSSDFTLVAVTADWVGASPTDADLVTALSELVPHYFTGPAIALQRKGDGDIRAIAFFDTLRCRLLPVPSGADVPADADFVYVGDQSSPDAHMLFDRINARLWLIAAGIARRVDMPFANVSAENGGLLIALGDPVNPGPGYTTPSFFLAEGLSLLLAGGGGADVFDINDRLWEHYLDIIIDNRDLSPNPAVDRIQLSAAATALLRIAIDDDDLRMWDPQTTHSLTLRHVVAGDESGNAASYRHAIVVFGNQEIDLDTLITHTASYQAVHGAYLGTPVEDLLFAIAATRLRGSASTPLTTGMDYLADDASFLASNPTSASLTLSNTTGPSTPVPPRPTVLPAVPIGLILDASTTSATLTLDTYLPLLLVWLQNGSAPLRSLNIHYGKTDLRLIQGGRFITISALCNYIYALTPSTRSSDLATAFAAIGQPLVATQQTPILGAASTASTTGLHYLLDDASFLDANPTSASLTLTATSSTPTPAQPTPVITPPLDEMIVLTLAATGCRYSVMLDRYQPSLLIWLIGDTLRGVTLEYRKTDLKLVVGERYTTISNLCQYIYAQVPPSLSVDLELALDDIGHRLGPDIGIVPVYGSTPNQSDLPQIFIVGPDAFTVLGHASVAVDPRSANQPAAELDHYQLAFTGASDSLVTFVGNDLVLTPDTRQLTLVGAKTGNGLIDVPGLGSIAIATLYAHSQNTPQPLAYYVLSFGLPNPPFTVASASPATLLIGTTRTIDGANVRLGPDPVAAASATLHFMNNASCLSPVSCLAALSLELDDAAVAAAHNGDLVGEGPLWVDGPALDASQPGMILGASVSLHSGVLLASGSLTLLRALDCTLQSAAGTRLRIDGGAARLGPSQIGGSVQLHAPTMVGHGRGRLQFKRASSLELNLHYADDQRHVVSVDQLAIDGPVVFDDGSLLTLPNLTANSSLPTAGLTLLTATSPIMTLPRLEPEGIAPLVTLVAQGNTLRLTSSYQTVYTNETVELASGLQTLGTAPIAATDTTFVYADGAIGNSDVTCLGQIRLQIPSGSGRQHSVLSGSATLTIDGNMLFTAPLALPAGVTSLQGYLQLADSPSTPVVTCGGLGQTMTQNSDGRLAALDLGCLFWITLFVDHMGSSNVTILGDLRIRANGAFQPLLNATVTSADTLTVVGDITLDAGAHLQMPANPPKPVLPSNGLPVLITTGGNGRGTLAVSPPNYHTAWVGNTLRLFNGAA